MQVCLRANRGDRRSSVVGVGEVFEVRFCVLRVPKAVSRPGAGAGLTLCLPWRMVMWLVLVCMRLVKGRWEAWRDRGLPGCFA